MLTRLVGIRTATPHERKKHGAEVVFTRRDKQGRNVTIYAATCYESWEQWGAIPEVLSENVPAVENWRRNGLEHDDDNQ